MDMFFYFLIIGSALVFLILYFDKHQRRRVTKLSKDVSNVQPLFQLRSAEQKLEAIHTMLYGRLSGGSVLTGRVNMNESARQYTTTQLTHLVNGYKSGKISLKNYQHKLTELHKTVNQVKEMNFGQAK
jgi:hypothetical protein